MDDRFDTVARQLRGFDMAMVETGCRYNELYWAAQDSNWGYAQYQAEKIRTAIENGLERRPKRAASAETFLTIALPSVEEAIAERDATLLRERLGSLRSTCNSCHEAEQVEFVHVGEPQARPFTALESREYSPDGPPFPARRTSPLGASGISSSPGSSSSTVSCTWRTRSPLGASPAISCRAVKTGRVLGTRSGIDVSTTDSDAKLARKGNGKEAKLSYCGNVLIYRKINISFLMSSNAYDALYSHHLRPVPTDHVLQTGIHDLLRGERRGTQRPPRLTPVSMRTPRAAMTNRKARGGASERMGRAEPEREERVAARGGREEGARLEMTRLNCSRFFGSDSTS